MNRLCRATLTEARHAVLPGYDFGAVSPGIVHLGAGAFHRAHQALLTDRASAAGERTWGIVAANLRSPALRDALGPQDGLYTLEESGADGRRLRVIGALRGFAVAPEDPDRLIALMASPRIRIVSLTITEKGYCLDPASGGLAEDHPDVLHDLAHPASPRSALGFAAAALRRRRAAGLAPFTLLSCDNLSANGHVLKQALTRLSELLDADFGRWAADTVPCPSTMVDRIVPALTAPDRVRIEAALGLGDAAPVISEAFLQWVIEDDFPLGRPDWAAHGAIFVKDAKPWEVMKLRLLNGAHSCLAYLGALAGMETVAEVMAAPAFASYLARLMRDEISPMLRPPPGADIAGYIDALLARFSNPHLRHRTAQIAMDGSQKLPQRLLPTIQERLATGLPFPLLALGVAAWMRFVAGADDSGRPLELKDPLGADLQSRVRAAGLEPARLAAALAGAEAVFSADLPRDPRFLAAVTAALGELTRHGAAGALKRLAPPAP
jgi:fructuronate reductase